MVALETAAAASSFSPPPAEGGPPAPSMDRLPNHLWEQIFSFLPVSSLLVSRAVCRGFATIIGSAAFSSSVYPAAGPARRDQLDDLHFLLFADFDASAAPFAAAYRPSRDRWVNLPLPRPDCAASCCRLRRFHASGAALALAEQNKGSLLVCDVFGGGCREIAPMISIHGESYALDLIDDGPLCYKIVAVSTGDRVISQVFDSATRSWVLKGEFLGRFAVLGNSAHLCGVLYCLSRAPDRLLAFDPVAGEWCLADVEMPSSCLVCPHILVHEGSLFLVGGVEEGGEMNRIVVWELDMGERRWRVFGIMPEELFGKFRGWRMNHFYTVDRRGVVCFCNTSSYVLLMCDLRGMRWWRPRKCPFAIALDGRSWLGHAFEPQIGSVSCRMQFARKP